MKEKKLSTLNEYYDFLLSIEKEARELFKEQLLKAEKKELTEFNSVYFREVVFKCSAYEDITKKMKDEWYEFKEWDELKTSDEELYVYRTVKTPRKAIGIKRNCYVFIWCKYVPTMKKSLFWNYFGSREPFMEDCSIQIIYDIMKNYKEKHQKELKFSL